MHPDDAEVEWAIAAFRADLHKALRPTPRPVKRRARSIINILKIIGLIPINALES